MPFKSDETKNSEEEKGMPKEESGLPSFDLEQEEVPEPPDYLSHLDDMKDEIMKEAGIKPRTLRKPIFVEVNDYKKVMEEITMIKEETKESEKIAEEMEKIKNENEKNLKKWNGQLEKIQRNLVFAEKTLFEQENN
jgi:hypothetical protein